MESPLAEERATDVGREDVPEEEEAEAVVRTADLN